MSRTYLHKMKALFMNNIIEKIPLKLQKHFNRHNGDRGEFRLAKKELEEKIAEKELKQQTNEIHRNNNREDV